MTSFSVFYSRIIIRVPIGPLQLADDACGFQSEKSILIMIFFVFIDGDFYKTLVFIETIRKKPCLLYAKSFYGHRKHSSIRRSWKVVFEKFSES